VITDPQPRSEARRREYDRSDALATMPLPAPEPIQALARVLADAMAGGETSPVRVAGEALLAALSGFYRVPAPTLRVLGVAHLCAGCLHLPALRRPRRRRRIRVWMRTIRERVSTRGAAQHLLRVLPSPRQRPAVDAAEPSHARLFWRVDHLYHLALATPPASRRPCAGCSAARSDDRLEPPARPRRAPVSRCDRVC
jgi:hypothetical protein